MSPEAPLAGTCASSTTCKNALIVTLLILLSITTTGWVVTATRDRPVVVSALPVTPEPVKSPAPAPLPPAPVEPAPQEMVEVLVAAKDLPVGTVFTREEVRSAVKVKKVPKGGLRPAYIVSVDDLIDKRISRSVRLEETFHPQHLAKGALITLPEGYDMASIPINMANAAAGFVGPGSRVNVLATFRKDNKVYAFSLLVNVLVVAVDTQTTFKDGAYPSMSTVSFAVKEKEALLLSLAKTRGCTLELLLRHPSKTNESDKYYDIDSVIKLLADERPKPAEPVEQPKGLPVPPPEGAPGPRPVDR